MTLTDKLEKLRRQQQQITEALRIAEAQVAIRQRKAQTRAKIILGTSILSMPAGERDALLPMLYGHLSERDRQFVSMCLAGEVTTEEPPAPDAQQHD